MTPALAPEVCELCREDLPDLALLTFPRGKPRRVCVLCLANAIQAATGFKMVKMVTRMLEARIQGPLLAEAHRQVAASVRAAAAAVND